MAEQLYRILGVEMSPYSVKVRSWFRYKGIAHRWEPPSPDNQREIQQRMKSPMAPLIITPEGEILQDSTLILEMLEVRHPKLATLPDDEGLRFVSTLLEDYGDKWGNKWLSHLRWTRPEDQQDTALRLSQAFARDGLPSDRGMQIIWEKMGPRRVFVGSNEQTAEQIEDSYRQALQLLEAHLAQHTFLLGERPCFGDFGLWGQLYCCLGDLTAGRWMQETAPSVMRWVENLLEPAEWPGATGGWATWENLSGTLFPLLQREIGNLFLPWSHANALALERGEEQMRVELEGREWVQKPQQDYTRSLATLSGLFSLLPDDSWCRGVLAEAGCARWLQQES